MCTLRHCYRRGVEISAQGIFYNGTDRRVLSNAIGGAARDRVECSERHLASGLRTCRGSHGWPMFSFQVTAASGVAGLPRVRGQASMMSNDWSGRKSRAVQGGVWIGGTPECKVPHLASNQAVL